MTETIELNATQRQTLRALCDTVVPHVDGLAMLARLHEDAGARETIMALARRTAFAIRAAG